MIVVFFSLSANIFHKRYHGILVFLCPLIEMMNYDWKGISKDRHQIPPVYINYSPQLPLRNADYQFR